MGIELPKFIIVELDDDGFGEPIAWFFKVEKARDYINHLNNKHARIDQH